MYSLTNIHVTRTQLKKEKKRSIANTHFPTLDSFSLEANPLLMFEMIIFLLTLYIKEALTSKYVVHKYTVFSIFTFRKMES